MTVLNGVNGAPPRGKIIQKFGGMCVWEKQMSQDTKGLTATLGTSVGKFPIDIVNVVKYVQH